MSTNSSSEQARAALRGEHGVRLVTSAEEGFAASDLAPGIYGFTSSPALASPLFAVRRYRNFEIHRLATGVALVGFVAAADAARLTRSAGEPVSLVVFPESEGEATTIVSFPYHQIVHHRQYSALNSAAIELHVSPAETMSV